MSFVFPTAEAFPVISNLNLNDSESVMLSFRSSFWHSHTLLSLHSIRLYVGISTSRSFGIIYLGILYFSDPVSKWRKAFEYYLNISFVCICTAYFYCYVWSSSSVCMYQSLLSMRLDFSMVVLNLIWLFTP